MNTNIINHIRPPEYSPSSQSDDSIPEYSSSPHSDSMPNYLPPNIPPQTQSLFPSTSTSTPLPS